jgi:hypothetical protein
MPAKLMAVLGVCRRKGRWEVSQTTTAVVLFGHCNIDFREAFADPEIEDMKLTVLCLFGNATFLMPEGVHIRPSVVSILASTGFDVANHKRESPLPTIAMETTTLFGRCRVKIGEDAEAAHLEVAEETPSRRQVDTVLTPPPVTPMVDFSEVPDAGEAEPSKVSLTSFDSAA